MSRRWCRLLFLVSAAAVGGCVAPHKPVVVTHPSLGWDGPANLTLDQITPAPVLKGPATAPVGRAPVEALLLYSRSREATLHNQAQAAIDYLQQAIVLDPYRFDLRYDLGWAYLNSGGGDDNAINAFEKAARLGPDNLDLQTELGRLYLDKKDLPAALNHLRLATQTSEYASNDGKAAVTDFYLGKALREAGYDRAALNQYSTLVARFDHPSLAMQQNSELAYLLQRPDSLFVEIGTLLEKHGEYSAALKAYGPAAEHEPDNFELQSHVAVDLAMDGQRDPAIDKAVDLIVRNRANAPSLGVLREVCQALNLDDGVVTTLRKLSAGRPDDQAILFALTDTLVARHRPEEAHRLLQQAWEKFPGEVAITHRLFALDEQMDLVNDAALLLIHALTVNPDSVENYRPLWVELLRAGLPGHLTVASVTTLNVPAEDEPARQFWLSLTAGINVRPMIQRTALESAVKMMPRFAPVYRALLDFDWDRPDWTNEQKIAASNQLAALASSGGDPALGEELNGRALLKQQKWSLAVDHFTQAVKLGGRSSELILAGANASRQAGRDPKYEQMLWGLLSDRPLFEGGYTSLFQYYAGMQPPSLEQAMKVLATWLGNDPQNLDARVLQVDLDIQAGQMRDAENELSRLYADDPDSLEVFQMMRRFYTQAGRVNDLEQKLEDRRVMHPRDVDVIRQLASLYADQKRNPEALRLLDNTRAVVADDADLLYFLSEAYSELGEKQIAEDVLQQVIKLTPAHPGACNDLGFSWADQGKNLVRAEAMIRAAVTAEPDNESFLDSLGWVLYKRGKFDEAKKYLQQAIAPQAVPDPVVLDHLGDTLYRLSKPDEAYKTWQQSLQGLAAQESRDDLNQLRLQLKEKIKQAEAKKAVDVAPTS
jgi:tetratricopeptide (TPR) repeat protein